MRAGFLLFPDMTQLDLTGPWEVLARLPGLSTELIWKNRDPVVAEGGLAIVPTTTFAACPPLDLLLVPGGAGVDRLLSDRETLAFVAGRAETAAYVVSVCTGALVLGAAGLLKGRKATTHWSALSFLPAFGAIVTEGRVVEDGQLVTGGGVTAGIDVALMLVARLAGDTVAQAIQLQLEYDPQPPFDCGTPARADPDLLLMVERRMAERRRARAAAVMAAVESLACGQGRVSSESAIH